MKSILAWVLLSLVITEASCIRTTDSLEVETRTLYFSRKTPVEMQRCIAYVVNSNYRRVEMLINSTQPLTQLCTSIGS
jgi:hypothetical protein